MLRIKRRQFVATTPAFNLPHSHLVPLLVVTPWEFCRHFRHPKTRVPGLSCGVVCMILSLAVSVEHRLATDGQTWWQLIPVLASITQVKMIHVFSVPKYTSPSSLCMWHHSVYTVQYKNRFAFLKSSCVVMNYSGALTPLRRWVSEARLAANKSSLRWTAAHSWHRQSTHAQTLPISWTPCTVSPSAEWPISSCSRQACVLRHHDINKLRAFYWQTKHSDIITSLGQTAIYLWTIGKT